MAKPNKGTQLTVQELAAMGGRAAWKNVSKEERSRRMRKLALDREAKRRKVREQAKTAA